MRRTPIIACQDCGLQGYELSTSDYVRQIGAIVENWESNYPVEDGVWEAIAEELQEIKDTCEESLENMPEGLQEGTVGELLQERIDALEEAISQLTDYDSMEDFLSRGFEACSPTEQEAIEAEVERREKAGKETDYESFYADFWECRYTGTLDEDEKQDADSAAESWKENTESEICDYISEAIGEIPY